MLGDSTYNYEGSEDFTIENGILKGPVVAPLTKRTNCGEWILDCMRAQPEFVGQVDALTGKKSTFAEMTEKSIKCAMWLRKQNIKTGDIIGICTHNQLDMYVPCFAALYTGAVFNPWCNVGLNNETARHFASLTRPKILFADEASVGMAVDAAREIGLEMKVIVIGKLTGFQSLDDIIAEEDGELVSEFRCAELSRPDDLAAIIYTSGSTGMPKGVPHSHRYIIRNTKVAEWCETNGPVKTMIFSSISWTTGIIFMIKGIVQPETRIIPPEFTIEVTFQLIEKFKVNCVLLGLNNACRLQKSPLIPKYDLTSLKKLVVTGGVLRELTHKALAASFPLTFISSAYGCTEFQCIVVEPKTGIKFGSCGTIVKNFSMKVVDTETGRILGPNEKGEACFKSPYMMTSYYGNPKASHELFDADGWLRTGDLVHYDEEGYVFVTDRIKEIINYHGHKIPPATIESTLQTHPEVAEAAVLAIPHGVDEEHPIAFVERTPSGKVTKAELEKLVADTLPSYMQLLGGVEFVNELPHAASGKIARAKLRKLARAYA